MLKKWCELTSCNGIIDLYESRNNKKEFVFWFTVMTVSLVASAFFVYRTILVYIQSPTITNVDTVTAQSLHLPDVLLEYHGGLDVGHLKKENFSENFIHAFSNSFLFHTTVDKTLTDADNELKQYMTRTNLSYGEVAYKFGYTCDDMVKYVIQAHEYPNKERCEKAELIITDRGNGYVFRNNLNQWYPGLWGGLRFVLKAPKNSYALSYPEKAFDIGMNHEFGITLENSLGAIFTKRIYAVPLDTKVTMTLNTKRYKRVNGTRRCISLETQYTSNTCYFDCWLMGTKACAENCIPVNALNGLVAYNDTKICNPLLYDKKCANMKNVQKCKEKCLPLCDEWMFETTITYSSLSYLKMNESISSITIGYSTMQYTKIEEVYAFTIDMAISNVGGQFGLWLGLSVVTFIQAFYYLILGVCFKTNRQYIVS